MKNFTLGLILSIAFSAVTLQSRAQCPTPHGMTGINMTSGNRCLFFVYSAIPNSTVRIFSAAGHVGTATADATGSVLIEYACSDSPILAVLSSSGGNICSTFNIPLGIVSLPIKLTSFTAHLAGSGVLLKWETSYEFDNEKYVIEKSTDGKNFQSIGQKAGALNSLEKNVYDFSDGSFNSGDVAYYRLKQIDIDGKFTYSKVVYVNSSDSRGQVVRVGPNPFVSEIQLIGINSANLNKNNIKLHNITGAQVNFEFSGANAIRVSPSAPSGMYFLSVNGVAYKVMKN